MYSLLSKQPLTAIPNKLLFIGSCCKLSFTCKERDILQTWGTALLKTRCVLDSSRTATGRCILQKGPIMPSLGQCL